MRRKLRQCLENMFSPALKDEHWSAMDMNAQATEPRTHISRLDSSKATLQKRDAVVRDSVGPSTPNRKLSAKNRDRTWTAPPVQFIDSQVDPLLEIGRASVTRTNQRKLVEDDKAEQATNPIQQPKSLTRKRPYISFLTDTVDQPWSPRPKRYRPESVDRFVTQWVESVSGPESYRERHCRSDSLLNHPDGDFISRRLTQSVPNMVNNCDAEGSTVPTTPESAVSRSNLQSFEPSDAATSADVTSDAYTTKSKKHLVEDQSYRSVNLDLNNIFMRSKREEFPEHISDLINLVSRGRNSPEPSFDPEQEDELEELARGAPETEVQTYFHKWIFSGSKNLLHCSDRMPMANHAVPSTCKQHKVSNPKPDLLFGYKRNLALPQHRLLGPLSKEMTATSSNQAYPFLLIEFKADSPSGNGSLLVATNQCLGGAASCVNLVERLNDRLKACKDDENRPLNSAAFSVAMNGTEARLFISWKHDVNYYLQDVRGFLLSEADHYLLFRKYMRNILDWGKDDRLNQIRESLDKLLEENRKMATAISKSRSSPSDDESGRNSKAKRNA